MTNCLEKFFKFLKMPAKAVFAGVLVCLFFANSTQAAGIEAMRIGQGVGSVRIVLDADSSFQYKTFLLNGPQRLVVDVSGVNVSPKIEKYVDKNNIVKNTRLGSTGVDGTRIVFDLQKPVIIKKAFMLSPQGSFGWRFVIDVAICSEREFLSKVGNDHVFSSQGVKGYDVPAKTTPVKAAEKSYSSRKVVVLDPGHGGKDPGAIGYSGVYEKNIVLSMGKELKKVLEDGGYKVYLTRSSDIFIPLRDRVKIARQHKPDLFISIHADSTKNRSAKGLSVYTLSEKASDKEAEALAERENKVDIIAGLNLVEHSKEVSDILINLAQRESMNRSSECATFMVQEMKKTVDILSDTHRFAGFAVLKAPDVPSILLEMGYLSNKTEEKLLQQAWYRKKLALSTKKALDRYFENMQRASLF